MRKRLSSKQKLSAFTIVELLIVIVVIGVLVSVTVVSYNGIRKSAQDKSLISDINIVESEIVRYGTKNKGVYGSGLNWNSSSGTHDDIPINPSPGNIIRVTATNTTYCIRAYNPKSSSPTLALAVKRGTCP